jgi:hypothetical protein
MAKTIIPAQVLVQCMNLSLEQVAAAMEGGGATVSLTSATFKGMMPGGAFVYQCTGDAFRKIYTNPGVPNDFSHTLQNEAWPDWLAEFKIKVVQEKNHLANYKPESRAKAARRMLDNEFIIAWG